jgi:tRNA-dihydrouridine synthase C
MPDGQNVTPFISSAPMEGVVDWIVRDLLTSIGGVDRAVTEFVRVTDGALPEHVFYRYCPELKNGGRTRSGVPDFVQLLGGKAEWLAENAKIAAALGAPGIDLNFGCPAKTVNRHDGGATLLQQPRRLYDIISRVRAAVAVPVTAKVRLGYENKEKHMEIARACSDAGAVMLTIHARTKTEGYTPPAHWEYIARMRSAVRIPILANGEIWTKKDYDTCAAASGVADVALGRGLVSRPDLALQIKGRAAQPMHWSQVRDRYVSPFFSMSLTDRGEAFAVARVKQLLKFLSRSFSEAAETFSRIKTLQQASEIRSEICPTYKCIPGPIANTASVPKIF